ncbi:basic amino acid ABC transporter substrate-binding protein [Priestia megaterium]|uniref:Basic amino acid ABC transporter substrate-binding protein n=1 Tax=Priestia megaterium TaxID=1404 RepID=A0A6H1NZI1_PRIMG|nr:basic amino acid ABC transporter substrate-binding protein [Priestia megaterium]QIZ06730.1 basic amino acid ABC transporter substrate-binding protein [Priestia megaterium]
MKKFKLFSTVLMVTLLLVLSACGTSKSTSTTTGGDGEKKTLRVVTDAAYAPFEYQDKGEVVGFDIDFINAVAKEAGYKIKVEHVGWDPIFVELDKKIADIGLSAITINDERKQTYDFSVPYFLSTNKILVPKDSDIKSAADLKNNKTVAVQNATTGQEAVEGLLGKNSDKIKKFENNNLAILELKSGGADAVVADNTVIEQYAKNNPKDNFVVIEDSAFAKEFYGLMFPKGSKIKADFDKAVKAVIDNGTYADVYKKWFKVEPDTQILKDQQ